MSEQESELHGRSSISGLTPTSSARLNRPATTPKNWRWLPNRSKSSSEPRCSKATVTAKPPNQRPVRKPAGRQTMIRKLWSAVLIYGMSSDPHRITAQALRAPGHSNHELECPFLVIAREPRAGEMHTTAFRPPQTPRPTVFQTGGFPAHGL